MQLTLRKTYIYTALFDAVAILFIYLMPTFSHLFSYPFYYFEPMRIVLILSLAHFRKSNAYIIAITLPLFSYIVSAHPVPLKVLLITGELVLNVYLFSFIQKKYNNIYASSFLSIVISKLVYYSLKYLFIALLLFDGLLVSTPIYVQLFTTSFLGLYLVLFLKRKKP